MPMAELDDHDDGAGDIGGGALGVVPLRDDAVQELAALAELHDEVDGALVPARLPQGHDARALGQVAHDGHLPAHVLHVDGRPQLALGDGLAGEQLLGVPIHTQVCHPELPAVELPVQDVLVIDPDDLAPLVARPEPRAASARRRRRRSALGAASSLRWMRGSARS
uniref:Uncharacterized protein n=1 Tax=Zea mays TaxID=4577 RepID=A0A804LJV8_MAIZE